ncbi:MAG TPA: SDR family oxidoreductase [Candidatus Nanoarchaeia archaeon]|nr:SDR family oxidoreductase [Candidatus Nanoarchaeia archaeon]
MPEVVLITGCSSGIGKTTALFLANRGYTVYATARKQEDLKRLVEDGKKIGKQIFGAQLDVNDANACRKIVAAVAKKEGKIDILINNAGYGQYGALEEVSERQLREQMETNFFAAARMIQLVIPHMREKMKGKIVNISSLAGRIGFPLGSPYNASKFALEGLSEAVKGEVKQFNIDVILIEPGFVKTTFMETAEKKVEEMEQNKQSPYHGLMVSLHSLWNRMEGNAGNPEDVAEIIYKAITDEKPKLRYAGTSSAKQMLIWKKILPDKVFEGFIMRRYGADK